MDLDKELELLMDGQLVDEDFYVFKIPKDAAFIYLMWFLGVIFGVVIAGKD